MSVLLEARPYRPFKSSEEYLIAMKEDLAEWLNTLYPELRMNLDNFMDRLDTGVAICKHANNVRRAATDYVARRQARKIMTRSITSSLAMPMCQLADVAFLPNAKAGTFFARDNVSNFISWCRNSLGIIDCLLFESDDLIMRKNERHVILCLLEVARRGAKFGMLAPMLVQMERQIDREIAAENKASNGTGNDESDDDYEEMQPAETCLIYGPQPQIVTNDLKSLDEMVRDLVEKCTCPTQFPMIRVSEGKYRIGDTKVLIFVRILRSHVMVRVGGGWDTLSHYLDKHDPCRCRTSHRSMISAKLIQKAGGSFDLSNTQVHYERSPPRTRRSSASSVGSCAGTMQVQAQQPQTLQSPRSVSTIRSRSPTPNQTARHHLGEDLNQSGKRSRSPTPHTKESQFRQQSDLGTKQRSRSPTPKAEVKSGRENPLDATRKALNEEIRHTKYDNRSQMYHSRHQDHYQDPKKDLHQEIRDKVPLSEEFSKRYIVEGGVARRASDKEDSPKYEPAIYNYKCGRADSSSPSLTPSPPAIKEESTESFSKDACHYSKTGHDGEQSDNGSEVSDEGYRSLGAVQPSAMISNCTPPTITTTANTMTDISNSQDLTRVVDCQKQPPNKMENERSCVETDSIETGLRKTKISPMNPMRSSVSQTIIGPTSERSPRTNAIVRESSNLSRCSSPGSRTPRDGNSSPEGSPLKRNTTRTSVRKIPTSGTVGAGGTASRISAVPRCYQNLTANGSNTWNGRQSKQRVGLSSDTFVNPSATSTNDTASRASPTSFTRKSSIRQSLPKSSGSNPVQYDKNGRRIKPSTSTSLQSSPTKIANPLLEQILQKVGHLQDDKQVVQKLQDLLRDYQSHDNESEDNLEFTRAWIDGNGTVILPHDVNPITSPRKDPKASGDRSGGFSRIPTPVYKRAMSVASDNI